MRKEHRLEKRGRIYYLRVVIPASIRHLYGSRKGREIRLSLKTSNRRVARIRCRDESARLEREFRERGARLLTERLGVLTKLDAGEEQKLLALWTRSVLQTDESERVSGFDDEDFEAYGGQLASTQSELRAILARGRVEAIEPALDAPPSRRLRA